jgi:hypothetical protein
VDTITASGNLPVIVSVYAHENGATYVSVVNNSVKESMSIQTKLKGEHRVWRVDFGPKESELVHTKWGDSSFIAENGATIIGTWLAPGQMELYRVE